MRVLAMLLSLVCIAQPGPAAVAATRSPNAPAATQPGNSEMTAIFDADQADRNTPNIDWSSVVPRDVARRARTKALLDGGRLHTGADFLHAAFVFQHGDTPNDYLLAHTLAVIAAARGEKGAAWIAAATLDRYLVNIGQKQIYGTQFMTHANQPVTQEPYDRSLISDSLRTALGVPPIKDQEEQRKEFEAASKDSGFGKP
ncbi:MAG TPA: hypothetical protein VG434_05300 [Sphingomicrobium sp.]|nr:hypothetical protein [Sphingomicrobium sp.]